MEAGCSRVFHDVRVTVKAFLTGQNRAQGFKTILRCGLRPWVRGGHGSFNAVQSSLGPGNIKSRLLETADLQSQGRQGQFSLPCYQVREGLEGWVGLHAGGVRSCQLLSVPAATIHPMHGHPRLVLPAFYLTHFAFVGLFVPYFGLYLRTLGFSDTRIGILLALIPLAKAALPGAWGAAADHWDIRRHLMIFSTWSALLAFTGFLTVTSFSGCLLVMAVFAAMAVPPLPFVEATTLEYVHTSGRDYGRIRVFGSISFALVALLYGRLAGNSTAGMVVPAALVVLALNAAVTSLVPAPSSPRRTARVSAAQILRLPGVGLLLAAGFLMQASHGAYLGFFSLVLEENGYPGFAVGMAWAGAVVLEVLLMVFSGRLVTALGIRNLMALSVAIAAFRWFLYAGSVAVPVLLVGQALHAFTYAGFHVAAVQTMQRLIPAGSRSTGQAFYSGWTFGAGIMAGTLYSGIIKDYLGTGPMFVSAGVMALAALAILLLSARPRPATVPA